VLHVFSVLLFLGDFASEKNIFGLNEKEVSRDHEDMHKKPTVSYFFRNEKRALNDSVLVLPFPL
jgi:hypothetical protein